MDMAGGLVYSALIFSRRQFEVDMAPIPKGGTIAVTGATGFIGSWVVRLLLDKGYRVRACVRDANDAGRTDLPAPHARLLVPDA